MANAKKTVSKVPVKKAPAKRKPAVRKQSTALTVRKPARYEGMLEEVEETSVPKSNMSVYSDKPSLDGSDLFIPRLRLAQGLTQEVQDGSAKPGQWLVLGSEPMDEVTVVPVAMTRRRELRDPDTRSVVCRSGDSVTGIGNPGGDCASCPMAEWTASAKKNGKNNAPACSFLYSYMVWVVEAETMAILEFSRTSITTGKMLNTMIVQRGIGTFAVLMSSTAKQGPKGTFYNPTVAMTNVKVDELKRAMNEASSVR